MELIKEPDEKNELTAVAEPKSESVPDLIKASDYTVVERRKWVMDQYLSGRYPYEIADEYMTVYGLTKHSYDADVVWVNQQLKKRGEQDIEKIVERHTDMYYHVYRLALEKKDYRSATNVLRNVEDLYKLHKPTTGALHLTNKTTTNYNLSNLSFDQIKELLDKGEQVIDITPKT